MVRHAYQYFLMVPLIEHGTFKVQRQRWPKIFGLHLLGDGCKRAETHDVAHTRARSAPTLKPLQEVRWGWCHSPGGGVAVQVPPLLCWAKHVSPPPDEARSDRLEDREPLCL